jgi:F-type H+-transporting ATPase subunit delta
MSTPVARRYATAIIEVAFDAGGEKAAAEVIATLREWNTLIAEVPAVRTLLTSPGILPQDRSRALAQVMAATKTPPLTARIIELLSRRRRLAQLRAIIEACTELLDQRRGIMAAHVRSAQKLSETDRSALTSSLNAMLSTRVELHEAVDPSLIAGLTVRCGDVLMDSSLRSNFERLERQLQAVKDR